MPKNYSVILIWFIISATWTHIHKNVSRITNKETSSDVIDFGCFCGVPENAEYKLKPADGDEDSDHKGTLHYSQVSKLNPASPHICLTYLIFINSLLVAFV